MGKFLLVILVLGIFCSWKNVEGGLLPSHRLFAEVHFTNFYITSIFRVIFMYFIICCNKNISLQEKPKFCKILFLQKPTRNSQFNFLLHANMRRFYDPLIPLKVVKLCTTACKSETDCLSLENGTVLESLPKEIKFDPNLLIH